VCLLGEVRVPLAYYHCSDCGQGQKPGERLWGLVGRQLSLGADQRIAISDGGSGLEEFFRTHFPKAECILDFSGGAQSIVVAQCREYHILWSPACKKPPDMKNCSRYVIL